MDKNGAKMEMDVRDILSSYYTKDYETFGASLGDLMVLGTEPADPKFLF
jgi:hypothetical protein